jgi:predicted metal-dependent hydrolase
MIADPPSEEPFFTDPRYRLAVAAFADHDWYLAHDAFEELWHESSGEIRALLHGLIQISVAEYHLENGNTRGSTLLMAEGLNHLRAVDLSFSSFDLATLQSIVAARLSALLEGRSLVDLPLPSLGTLGSATA